MSRMYSLVCHETKQALWIGQSSNFKPAGMAIFYSGDADTLTLLGRFLEETRGKSLVLVDSETVAYEDFVAESSR